MTSRERSLLTVVFLMSITIIPWSLIVDQANLNELKDDFSKTQDEYLMIGSYKLPTEAVVSKLISLYGATISGDNIVVIGMDKAINMVNMLEKYNYPIKSIDWNGREAVITRVVD